LNTLIIRVGNLKLRSWTEFVNERLSPAKPVATLNLPRIGYADCLMETGKAGTGHLLSIKGEGYLDYR